VETSFGQEVSGGPVAYRQLSWCCPEMGAQVDVTVRSYRLELVDDDLETVARSALCHGLPTRPGGGDG